MSAELESGHFKGGGGVKLFYQCFRPSKPLATLVFCHGFGEHSHRYQLPIGYFTERYNVYLMDLRGHGYSDGLRVYADSIGDYLEDLRQFLKFVQKREGSKKIFLVGHSFGGQLALNLLAASRNGSHEGIAGLILSSPNIRLRLPVPVWKRLAARWLSLLFPKLALGNELKPEDLSHDPEVIAAWKVDPQIQTKITLKLGQLILENQDRLPGLAPLVRVPSLFLHGGDDPICSPDGTKDFFAGVSAKDKTIKIYKGFFHEIFNEVGREKVYRDMEKWIEERI